MSNLLSGVFFKTSSNPSPYLNLESTAFMGHTGLRHRLFLPEEDGVLFEFDRAGDHSFWMESVSIPIDIIFINAYNYIMHIHAHARPNTTSPISSGKLIRRVIETNAGWCARNGVIVGTEVSFTGISAR